MTTSERFRSKYTIETGGCWVWTAYRNDAGYGIFRVGQRNQKAHRVSYELHVGPIPDGLQLDHLCRNRGCVNPAHLEPVTSKVNTERGDRHLTSGLCPKCGRPYDREYQRPSGHLKRHCSPCRAEYQRNYNATRSMTSTQAGV